MKSKLNIYRFKKAFILLSAVFLGSCASKQDIIYFQDEPLNSEMALSNNYEIKFKPADLLTIDISAQDPEAVAPFLLTPVAQNASSTLELNRNVRMQTYLIDINGNIEFPVLGSLKLEGLSRVQATEMLKIKLSEYIKDPIVNVRLINFTITILGEVNAPGSYTVQNERISLSDALGLAGDLTIYGKRDNVLLIREVEGQKRYAKFDLNSVNVLNSPNYYLTQNDVIYVEPNSARVRQSSYNPNNGIIISAVATLATIAAILIK
ncbi:MAG: polysaccharide biosynthesis/export family protein [Flavobacteriaceae bacterium]|nr:polysaccharide biosynthesis/export family protein [Flavobacteriaceae bacterium]